MTPTGTTRRIQAAGVALAVSAWGDPQNPTVVLVHGYPDTKAVWQGVIPHLEKRFHVVAYDVRGAGESDAPTKTAHYGFKWLTDDFLAVIAAMAPGKRVHLVGHDWGSIQGWEFASEPAVASGIAGFTSISGPPLAYAQAWFLEGLHPHTPENWAARLDQAARSWYISALKVPGLAEAIWPTLLGPLWPRVMAELEGVKPAGGHPAASVGGDGARGAWLYRENLPLAIQAPPKSKPALVPVQLVIPTLDRYVSPRLYDSIARCAPELRRLEIAAGHWVVKTHPEALAAWIETFIDELEHRHERGILP